MQALEGKDITIQGTGSQTRSFQYVDDLVEGLIKLMNSDYSQPVNLGSPDEISVKVISVLDLFLIVCLVSLQELAEKVLNIVKTSTSTVKYEPSAVDDPVRSRPDVSVAAEKIKWRPVIGLEEGLQRSVDYFRKELHD